MISLALMAAQPFVTLHTGLPVHDENNLIFAKEAYVGLDLGYAPSSAGLGWILALDYTEANAPSYNHTGDVVSGDHRSLTATINAVLYADHWNGVRPYAGLGAGYGWRSYDLTGSVDYGATSFVMDAEDDGPVARALVGFTADLHPHATLDISIIHTTGHNREIPIAQGPSDHNPGIWRVTALRVGLRKDF